MRESFTAQRLGQKRCDNSIKIACAKRAMSNSCNRREYTAYTRGTKSRDDKESWLRDAFAVANKRGDPRGSISLVRVYLPWTREKSGKKQLCVRKRTKVANNEENKA